MKKPAFALATLILASSVFAAPRTYTVTSDGKNYAMFSSEATLETIHGRTSKVSGTIVADPANVAASSVDVAIDLASVDTGISMRNEHMRDRFLNVEKFPTATFKSVSVKGPKTIAASSPAQVSVTGDLTIHGVTKRITVPVRVVAIPESELTKSSRGEGDWVHATTEFSVKLGDYGVAVPSALVMKLSDVVTIKLDVFASATGK
jgi:polyisoprenoid-binding protein YceI